MLARAALSWGLLASVTSMAAAHFTIHYPEMRGDTFANGSSQWIYPCANVNQTENTNRTLWPLSGGAVSLDLHHPWTYAFVNLGIGTEYPAFETSLTPELVNVTGNGTFCMPQLTLPAGLNITQGTNASLQIVTLDNSGSALYNCADITFSDEAPGPATDICTNSTGVSAAIVRASESTSGTPSDTSSAENATESTSAATGGFSGSAVSALCVGAGALVMSYFFL